MNKRTVKRVKDPKACIMCDNCVTETNNGRPDTYRCKVRPIEAKMTMCKDCKYKGEAEEPPYQAYLQILDDGKPPRIVLRSANRPVDAENLVKLDGLVVDDMDARNVASAVCDRLKDPVSIVNESVGPDLVKAGRILSDICALNEELSAESAIELVHGARRCLDCVARTLDVNLEG